MGFPKYDRSFLCFHSIIPGYKKNLSVFRQFLFYLIKLKPERNSQYLGNIDSTKNADHILEILRQGEFCGYCFKYYTYKRSLTTEYRK